MSVLLAALLSCAAANGVLRLAKPEVQDSLPVRLGAQDAVESASLFGLGMRRLAADLALIRLLIYYGTVEVHESHAHQPGTQGHAWEAGEYPELGPRAKRILDLDPSFGYAALYGAGVLAFNLHRPREALDLLEYGLVRDPRNAQFHAYIAAIGFHRSGNMRGVLRLLEPVLAFPDCPTMVKHLVAFLYKQKGERGKALRLYREILETSRDQGYRAMAERALRDLENK